MPGHKSRWGKNDAEWIDCKGFALSCRGSVGAFAARIAHSGRLPAPLKPEQAAALRGASLKSCTTLILSAEGTISIFLSESR